LACLILFKSNGHLKLIFIILYLNIFQYHFILCKTTAKNPSLPSFWGKIFNTYPFTTYKLWIFVKCFICYSFYCFSKLHVIYRSFPFFFKNFIALLNICCCSITFFLIVSSVNLSFMSGFLLIVPVPVHGASTMTQSILPKAILFKDY